MPFDDTLPPSRLPAFPELDQILAHFASTSGIRVDTDGLDRLPAVERQRYAAARPLEPPEAALLDRVLQLVPPRLLRGVKRIVVLPTRGTARPGGYLNGIVSVSAAEADVGRTDAEYGNRFSVFTTTVLHEIGHAIFDTVLSPEQQEAVRTDYLEELTDLGDLSAGEPSEDGAQHYFIAFFVAAVLGYGRPPRTAGVSRRKLARFGLDPRRP
jgi:hypothetical protein